MSGTRPGSWGDRLTITIPEAAEILGLSRGLTYSAANRGDLPVIVVGRRKLVPVPALRALLGLPPASEGASERSPGEVDAPCSEGGDVHASPVARLTASSWRV